MYKTQSKISKQWSGKDGHLEFEPLGDDAIIRFALDENNVILVAIRGDVLDIHHSGEDSRCITVKPEAYNIVKIVLLDRR